jgi:Uncharacterized protein conserved in bacteria (DUF2252)
VRTSFVDANKAYEEWLRSQCDVVEPALNLKHCRMRKSALLFLRATFFRWAAQIKNIAPELAKAPEVLSVGDAHVQNFGIWHDHEGRFVWGVNDFDDAAITPYPSDLIRLATSAVLSKQVRLRFSPEEICAAIREGYSAGITRPRAFVLNERHWWLRDQVRASKESIARFWKEIDELHPHKPPSNVVECLRGSLPGDRQRITFACRTAGGGSLGRPRYVATARWHGGRIVREAKALVPSGWDWSHGTNTGFRYLEVAQGASRSPDPHLQVCSKFLLRRLSPESRKLELGHGDDIEWDRKLLSAMGHEIGSIHADSKPAAAQIMKNLNELDAWFEPAVNEAAKSVRSDFDEWKEAAASLFCKTDHK